MAPDLLGRLRAAGRRWPDLGEYAVLGFLAALCTLAICVPTPGLWRSHDVFRQSEAYFAFARRALFSGRLPEWNPYVGLGRPFLADIETGIFYPPNWLPLLLGTRVGLFAEAALHGAALVLGMVALARKVGVETRISVVCGFLLAGSGPFLANLLSGQIHLTFAACWLPAAWLATAALVEKRSLRAVSLTAIVLALQLLAGNPQVSWMTWLSAGLWLLLRRLQWPPRFHGKALLGDLLLLAAAGILASLLCGIQLVPFATLVMQSVRHASSLTLAAAYATEPIGWLSWFRPANLETFPVTYGYYAFAGSATIVAGMAGFFRPRDASARALSVIFVVFAVISAGMRTPLFRLLFHLVPGLGWFRVHARANVVMVFVLLLMAGLFVSLARKRLETMIVLAVVSALGVCIAWPRSGEGWSPIVALPFAAFLLGLSLCAARPGRSGQVAPWLLVAMLAMEIIDSAVVTRRLALGVPEQTIEPNLAALLESQGKGEVAPLRVSLPYPWIRETAGMTFGWSTFTHYGPLPLARVWNYLHGVLGLSIPEKDDAFPSTSIYRNGIRPYNSMNLRVGFRAHPAQAVLIPDPDPRAYLATQARRVATAGEAIDRMRDGHDFHREPLVEEDLVEQYALPSPWFAAGPARPSAGEARISAFASETLNVETTATAPALLVLAEAWFPGWEASIDGKAAPCFPVNAWMRAVSVPAGTHQVLLRFTTPGLLLGSSLTLIGLTLLLVSFRVSKRRTAEALGERSEASR